MPDKSIHMSIYSPPFGGLYQYSSDEHDLSNCTSREQFFDHYRFVVQELFRLTLPGRITCVHCADIPNSNSGDDDLLDLPGEIIRMHKEEGWRFIARHAIWKEPLWVRNRTMTHNLSHKTIVDDAAYGGVASMDQLIIFRKRGRNPIPIENPTGLDNYAGECPIPPELLKYKNWEGSQTENRFSHQVWRRYASSVWDDIRMSRVLPYEASKDPEDEKHVHPLQLDVIERAVVLRSMKDEIVLTPFMGVGSEVYGAVINGRRGIGIELKPSYYKQAIKNLDHAARAEAETHEMDLFS